MLNKTQKKELQNLFKERGVLFAYFFGSQVTGKTNKDSDYDFAVMLPKNLNKHERFDLRLKMIGQIGHILKNDNVDLIILNDLRSTSFKFEIISQGEVIHEADHSARVDFEVQSMNNYYEYKPFLNLYVDAFFEREALA